MDSVFANIEFKVDWQAHLEALPLATWISEPKGGNIFVNQAYRRLLGVHSLDEVSGEKWARQVHPDDRKAYVRAWHRFVNGMGARFRETMRWVRPDTGQTIKLAVRVQKLRCGKFQGWIRAAVAEQAIASLERLTYVR